jgi:hypothetical protein
MKERDLRYMDYNFALQQNYLIKQQKVNTFPKGKLH